MANPGPRKGSKPYKPIDYLLDLEDMARRLPPDQVRRLIHFTRRQWEDFFYSYRHPPTPESMGRTFERWKAKIRELFPGLLVAPDEYISELLGAGDFGSGKTNVYAVDQVELRRLIDQELATADPLEEHELDRPAPAPARGERERNLGMSALARTLGVSYDTVKGWAKAGLIPFSKPKGRVLFNLEEVKEALLLRPRIWEHREKVPSEQASARLLEIRDYLNLATPRMAELLEISPHTLKLYMGQGGGQVKTVPKSIMDRAELLLDTIEISAFRRAGTLGEVTCDKLKKALAEHGGSGVKAAKALGIGRGSLTKLALACGVSLTRGGEAKDKLRSLPQADWDRIMSKHTLRGAAKRLGVPYSAIRRELERRERLRGNPGYHGGMHQLVALGHCPCHEAATAHSNPPKKENQAFMPLSSTEARRQLQGEWKQIKVEARRRGFKISRHGPPRMLSSVRLLGNSEKVAKGLKQKVVTAVLYLSPDMEIYKKGVVGKTLCPWATPYCSSACLGHESGQLAMPSSLNARLWKTALFMLDRALFERMLNEEIADFERRVREQARGYVPAVRLDGTSDLGLALRFAKNHPGVQFYDYTKSPKRMQDYLEGKFPPNWHLTFSYSDDPESERNAIRFLSHRGVVAVVFGVPPGIKKRRKPGKLPDSWHGFPVVDADVTDVRFQQDPGTVAGLRLKGRGFKTSLKKAGAFVQRMPEAWPEVELPGGWPGEGRQLPSAANPGYSPAAREFIQDEIHHLVHDKGYEPRRAVAAAHSVARKKGFKVPKKSNPPAKGTRVLLCVDLAKRLRSGGNMGYVHWFHVDPPVRFQRPNGQVGEAGTIALCDKCQKKQSKKGWGAVPLGGDLVWGQDTFDPQDNPAELDERAFRLRTLAGLLSELGAEVVHEPQLGVPVAVRVPGVGEVYQLQSSEEEWWIKPDSEAHPRKLVSASRTPGSWPSARSRRDDALGAAILAVRDLASGRKSNPHDEHEEHECSCPQCGGYGQLMGQLGNREWFRCRQCGWDWSRGHGASLPVSECGWCAPHTCTCRRGNPPPDFWQRELERQEASEPRRAYGRPWPSSSRRAFWESADPARLEEARRRALAPLPETYPLPPPDAQEWFWQQELARQRHLEEVRSKALESAVPHGKKAKKRSKKAPAKKKATRKKNPLMALINPNDGKKKGNGTKVVGWISARDLESDPAYEQAQKRYKKFHGKRAKHALVVRVNDGKPGVTQKVVAALGHVPQTHYQVTHDPESNKGDHYYVHDHPEGREPLEVIDPETGLTTKLPMHGGMRITDWWYN